jgi:hypothetical protein
MSDVKLRNAKELSIRCVEKNMKKLLWPLLLNQFMGHLRMVHVK